MPTKFIGVFSQQCLVAELELDYPGGQRIILNEANLRKRIDRLGPDGVAEKEALVAMLERQKSDGGKLA